MSLILNDDCPIGEVSGLFVLVFFPVMRPARSGILGACAAEVGGDIDNTKCSDVQYSRPIGNDEKSVSGIGSSSRINFTLAKVQLAGRDIRGETEAKCDDEGAPREPSHTQLAWM